MMTCQECRRELSGPAFGYANAADSAVLGHTSCCSAECAILNYLSALGALDKAALLPVLVQFGEDPTQVMFRLEDALMRARATVPA
jgi:hypothetical protein